MFTDIDQKPIEILGLSLADNPAKPTTMALRKQIRLELARRYGYSLKRAKAEFQVQCTWFMVDPAPDQWNRVYAMMCIVQALSKNGTLGKEAKD